MFRAECRQFPIRFTKFIQSVTSIQSADIVNATQTLELFARGVISWNRWARKMTRKKHGLREVGQWTEGPPHSWNDATRDWHRSASVDFSGHVFEEPAYFNNFRFPGRADFQSAVFERGAEFQAAEFLADAIFIKATFSRPSTFSRAHFVGDANFAQATFAGEADFAGKADFAGADFHRAAHFHTATFGADAHFGATKFRAYASFQHAKFQQWVYFVQSLFYDKAIFQDAEFSDHTEFDRSVFFENSTFNQALFHGPLYVTHTFFKKGAVFTALRAKSLLLFNVEFTQLPVFSAAHFDEPPQFDNVDLDPASLDSEPEHLPRTSLPGHWRALRALATRGHNHELELQTFKGEIIARRGTVDTWVHPRFWAGWLYEILSDFGLSMIRPLTWLLISLFVFAGIYASQGPAFSRAQNLDEPSCISGSGHPQTASLTLSVHYAFPFTGIASSGRLERAYACLYGMQPPDPGGSIPSQRIDSPITPASMGFLGVVQFFLSVLLIFLFGLSLRNWFRIK